MNTVNVSTCSSFVLAVSGGVDSMVLLDMVRKQRAADTFVVAHFNHGIRDDQATSVDKELIESYCEKYDLQFEYGSAKLGSGVSEESARDARYAFLREVATKHRCGSIMTAHHQDDVAETAIINMLRGTKSKGLTALSSTEEITRPLLAVTKEEIQKYAEQHEVQWNEDTTNTDDAYLRNYVRRHIVPKLKAEGGYDDLQQLIAAHRPVQDKLSELMDELHVAMVVSSAGGLTIDRSSFIQLDHAVACELARSLFEFHDLSTPPTTRLIDQLVVFCKTAKDGAKQDISKRAKARIVGDTIKISLE